MSDTPDPERSILAMMNGTESLDWQEVWCMRCKHDHDMHPGGIEAGGCEVFLRALVDEPTPEVIPAGYIIHTANGEDHEIPAVCNSLPHAAFCTKWEACEPQCMTHVNGAVITGHTITKEGWRE